MAMSVLTPVQFTATTSIADLTSAVPAGKEHTLSIRAANIAAADAYVDLLIHNGATAGYRLKNYPVPYLSGASAPDLEINLLLPAGYKLQVQASVGSAVALSVTGYLRDAE